MTAHTEWSSYLDTLQTMEWKIPAVYRVSGSVCADFGHLSSVLHLVVVVVVVVVFFCSLSYIESSRPEWCISSMMYSRDTPFWSETHVTYCQCVVYILAHRSSYVQFFFFLLLPPPLQWQFFLLLVLFLFLLLLLLFPVLPVHLLRRILVLSSSWFFSSAAVVISSGWLVCHGRCSLFYGLRVDEGCFVNQFNTTAFQVTNMHDCQFGTRISSYE